MNSSPHVPSPRTILTLLVLAQVVFLAVHQLWQGLAAGLLDPLGHLVFGHSLPQLHIGPFNLSLLITSVFSALITIIVGTVSTVLVVRVSWRFISRVLPVDDRRDTQGSGTLTAINELPGANKGADGNPH